MNAEVPDRRDDPSPWFLRAAAAFGFFGVAAGAFGAHGLEKVFAANGRRGTWETAALYHLVHAVALLALANRRPFPRGPWTLLAAGIVVFSGSLYLLAYTGATLLGAVTPLGGVCFLAGWAWLAVRKG